MGWVVAWLFWVLKETERGLTSKTFVVTALDDLVEKSRSILGWRGENLQEVTVVIEVHEEVETLDLIQILLHLDRTLRETLTEVLVIGFRDFEESRTSVTEVLDRVQDVFRPHRDVLDTRSSVVIHVFLDLGLPETLGRFVDRHLDHLVVVSHHDTPERGVLRVDLLVIDTPETVEVQNLLVPLCGGLHTLVRLVPDDVIDEFQPRAREELRERILRLCGAEAWQEHTLVAVALHEGVIGVTVLRRLCVNTQENGA